LTSPFAVSGEVGTEGYYRPLTVATFAANYALGRLDPFGYLVMNLVLHIAVSWMVYGVGCRLLGDWRWALVAAVVFALHPVNAEAVNYIVARSSLLAALGALAAFWAFLRWRDGGGWAWPVLGAAVFAAALFSKESASLIIPMWASLAGSLLQSRASADGRGSLRWSRRSSRRCRGAPSLRSTSRGGGRWWPPPGARGPSPSRRTPSGAWPNSSVGRLGSGSGRGRSDWSTH
jgi:hypothetical protein